MYNLLLVDDHTIIRTAMKVFIAGILPGCKIAEAYDWESALEKIMENEYDLVILDLNRPDTDSMGLVSNILALKPKTKILIFSMNDEDMYAKRFLKIGVNGFIRKDGSGSEIKRAIMTLLDNKSI